MSVPRISTPDVISMNLAWQESSSMDVLSILNMIPSQFDLDEMFEISPGIQNKRYFFRGMIWFWGLHYFCYIRHINELGEAWIEYNDKEMKKWANWEELVDDCVRTWSTPTLLVFENIETVDQK